MGNEELNVRVYSQPGIAAGLAWTPYGGDVLFIEATRMPGNKGFQITGSIGTVMQEDRRAPGFLMYGRELELGISPDFFDKNDIHMHVPSGATPKDGPSAGVTMVAALVSLLTDKMIKPGVGMTGEITLRGQVLPVGGIKEKVLAAHRNGLSTVILPKRNKFDLEDVPAEVRNSMTFIYAETMDDVLKTALELKPVVRRKKRLAAKEI